VDDETTEGEAEGEEALDRFPFFASFSAFIRSLSSAFDTPIIVFIASVNRRNSGLSGGFFMGI